MKVSIYALCMLILLQSCSSQRDTETPPAKKIQVRYHPTIETVMILRALSADDYFLQRIPDTFKGRPMLFKAREYFKAYKSHPAVAETQRLLYDMQDIGGQLLQGVVYYEELPGTKQISTINNEYWMAHKDVLDAYMAQLSNFYEQAEVAAFLEQHKAFYEGTIAEASSYINDSITAVMEQYLGRQNKAYYMYVLPVCPYGWAFSLTTSDSSGNTQHAVISPVTDIAWQDSFSSYGFGGAEARAHYRELVVHEFAHSFITDLLEQDVLREQIAIYDSLYTPLLDSAMGEQGYSGWWSYVNEHLVRLAHTRVAATFDKQEAEALRKADKEYGFVLLPESEELIKEYENNRDKYPTIEEYLPVLINGFKYYDTAMVNSRLR